MKKILLIGLLFLTGCATTTTVVDQTHTIVISPPESLLNCPTVQSIPDWKTLTNQQVANFIDQLYRYNKTCHINMENIEKYIAEARKIQTPS